MQDTRALHLTDLIIPARAFGATLRGSGARFSLICTAGAERLWLSMTVIRSLSASRMVSGAFAEEVCRNYPRQPSGRARELPEARRCQWDGGCRCNRPPSFSRGFLRTPHGGYLPSSRIRSFGQHCDLGQRPGVITEAAGRRRRRRSAGSLGERLVRPGEVVIYGVQAHGRREVLDLLCWRRWSARSLT